MQQQGSLIDRKRTRKVRAGGPFRGGVPELNRRVKRRRGAMLVDVLLSKNFRARKRRCSRALLVRRQTAAHASANAATAAVCVDLLADRKQAGLVFHPTGGPHQQRDGGGGPVDRGLF